MLLKVCSYLWKIDRELFKTFLTDKEMNGSNRKYFSCFKIEIDSPQKIENSNIYVIGNISANHACNIISRLLNKYRISKNNFKVYLCKDLSSLHIETTAQKTNLSKQKNPTNIDEVKIGQHIRNTFENIFSEVIPDDELRNLQDKTWCHDTFGICYAVLKLYQQNISFEQQRQCNGYNRYYKELYVVNGEKYLLCSQWFKEFRIKFDGWVKTRNIKKSLVARQIKIYNGNRYGTVELDDSIIAKLLTIICNRLNTDKVLIVNRLRKECNYLISSCTKYQKSPQTGFILFD